MTFKNFDEFLADFGNPGKCQIFYGIIIISVSMQWTMIQQFNVVMSYVPDHHCKKASGWNVSQFTFPIENDVNQCEISVYETDEKIPCPNGWNYITLKGEIYPSNEFDLVCEREYLFRLALTVPYIGVMLGGLICGYLSDKYGRKRALVCVVPMLSALTIGCAYSPDLTSFIIIRFFQGVMAQGVQTIVVTYSSELFRRKTRTIISYIFSFNAAITLPLQLYIIYFLLSWRTLQLIQGILLLTSVVTTWFLPESVSWLVSKNKLEKAEEILIKFAKFNKLPISSTLTKDLLKQSQEFEQKQSNTVFKKWKKLFCNSTLRRLMISIMYMMFANNCVNSGLSFSISALDGNLYTNYLTNSGLQIVVLAIFLALFTRFGRVKLLMFLFICSGLLCSGGYILIYYSKNWDQVIKSIALLMALVSRNLTSASTAMISQYSAELLPTSLRSTGLGLGFTACRLGSTLTPQILYTLNHVWQPLPQTIFGCMMFIGAIVIAFLPETFNKCLPRTIEDVENLMGIKTHEEKRPLLAENSSPRKYSEFKSSCDKNASKDNQ